MRVPADITTATQVFGSRKEAKIWLRRPAMGLDHRDPIDFVATPEGIELVRKFLGRLEYCVYT